MYIYKENITIKKQDSETVMKLNRLNVASMILGCNFNVVNLLDRYTLYPNANRENIRQQRHHISLRNKLLKLFYI